MQRPNEEWDLRGADLFGRHQIRNYLVFVMGSLHRRRWLATGVFVSIIGMAVAVLMILPRTYHVEAKLLAQRSQVLAIRGDSPDADVAPTRGATDTVLRRDNLVAIALATDLVRHRQQNRNVLRRMVDAVRQRVGMPDESEQDRIDATIELLEKRLVVWTTDGTVSIAIDWPHAQMAVLLVDTAQRNFLEQRYAQEITTLVESSTILQGHAASSQKDIDRAVLALEKLRDKRPTPASGGAVKAAPLPRFALSRAPAVSGAVEPDPELVRMKGAIDATERSIVDLEDARRRGLAETQSRLVEQRVTFTENHPVVLELEQARSVLSTQAPEVGALRRELVSLQAGYASKRAEQTETLLASRRPPSATRYMADSIASPPEVPTGILALDQSLREERDPSTVYARGQLRDAMDKYSALRAQVQAAQIDLETAQAAFKYRYSVLTPAQFPKKPVKPNLLLMLMLALVAAGVSALTLVTVADMCSGRLLERWQLEDLLGGPILGEIEFRKAPRRKAV